ncbi:MAG: Asp-tRNA(Asn)/Glu-tRNA(Gln) amidotransferase subunit GatA [bacterium]
MELTELTILELKDKLSQKEVKAVEVTESYLKNIDNRESDINAYLTVCREQALTEAAGVDEKIAKGNELAPLAGIPIAIKDNMCTKGVPTSCASRILDGFIPPYDATVIQKLKDQGAIILGKTNMDEFAMGSSTENSSVKMTSNPHDPARVPGGSSGGSAAVVAADMAAGSYGSDTGGSIRQPASFCGVFGLKPTYGLVSRFGLVAFASSLDQIGPLARTAEDTALLLSAVAGEDIRDSTSLSVEIPDYLATIKDGVKGLTIGLPKEFDMEGLDQETAEAVQKARQVLTEAGANFKEVSLPHTKYGTAAYYVVATAEASANLARYEGVKYGFRSPDYEGLSSMYLSTRSQGFGEEAKRRILLGTYVLSSGYYDAYYLKAQKVRTKIREDFIKVYREVDLLLTPTSPTTAFKQGEKVNDPLSMYLSDIFTLTANLAGVPSLSVPFGFDSRSLPIGVQLWGNYCREEVIFRAAYTLEGKAY